MKQRFKNKYLTTDIAQYANSYCKIKTLAPLPQELPESKFLFTPCQTEKEFYANEPNWTNCYIWEKETLAICSSCAIYLQPSNRLGASLCEACEETRKNKPHQSWWENNKNLLIIASLIALALIISQKS